jgi:TRAP-type C4-dicarboxylate transport system permease small subunit
MLKEKSFSAFAQKWAARANLISIIAVIAMFLLVVADILGRNLFQKPVRGCYDIVGFLALIISAFSLAQTEALSKHITVDVLTVRMPARWQRVLRSASLLFSLVFLLLAAWYSVQHGLRFQAHNSLAGSIDIPLFPFAYVIAAGCFLIILVIAAELVDALREIWRR